ncbi:hypothetical protein [Alkalicoccus saliphilus]|uniref:Uncharacterized protein n=1 Tax=Alkalicoccus saliphilus TaxID=200989 RepID=A0A2T4U5T9_9BACI|nr:hypothetical protein [Alkalicoccus saliphilus]PTL38759.1 hypothetical protein C6Y45_09715 [Alkalicoccus saliphilus]
MGKKACWTLIVLTVVVNVVMLQWTIEAYLGHEFDKVFQYSTVAFLSALFAGSILLVWRRMEYRPAE